MIATFARHPTAANLLMLLILALGLVALPSLRRETFPDFTINQVQVRVLYPGATAEEVENAVCQRVEDAVDRVENVDEVTCEAREGVATATIDMNENADPDRALSDVKTEVEAIDTFPDLVKKPVTSRLNRTDRVTSIAITGPMGPPALKVYAEGVRDRLLAMPEVSQVTLSGFSDRQFRIELDEGALRRHGLSVEDVARVVGKQSVDLPAGSVETEDRSILVRFADERRSVQALEDLVVVAKRGGTELRLGDFARITDRFELDEAKVLFNGRRAALLTIAKTKAEDTLTVFAAVSAFLDVERARAPPGVTYSITRDSSSIVQQRLDMLTGNAWQGFVLVFLVMWLFFSLRFSFWVAMGLPVSLAGTVLVMAALGLSINMITMVALLIALGLVMDDAIVISENVATRIAADGLSADTVIKGVREVSGGVLGSFVTTVCVFGPLAFLEGDVGRVMKVLPVVLIAVLTISLVEAFLILPRHLAHGLRASDTTRRHPARLAIDRAFERVRERGLGRLVDAAVAWRYLTIGLVIAAFLATLGLILGGTLKFRVFPDIDGNVLEARVLLPQGTPLSRTEAVVDHVTAALHRVDAAFTPRQPGEAALVRAVSVRFNENADAFETGPHLATIGVDLLVAETRTVTIDEIVERWRAEIGPVPDVLALTFKEPQVGPGGLPIDIRLRGADLDALKAASLDLQGWFRRYRGVYDLQDDLRPGRPEVRLRLREGTFGLGLDAATLAQQLRAAYFGNTAARVQVGPEAYEVDVRLDPADRASLERLENFPVTLKDGRQAPLGALAVLEDGRGWARIARADGHRTVQIRAELDTRHNNANEILNDTRREFLPAFQARHPGVTVELQGQAKEQAKSGGSLRRGFLIGLFGIFVLLSFQFRSYVEPLIVMAAIPLAFIGVVLGHVALGLPLSMPSIVGFVALSGVVVNDSILLVEFVKQRAAEGHAAVAAARFASRQRFRAVLLTSATTIAGLLPLLFERSLQAQVLIPLVTSLVFGLLASTVLVLLVIPALYAVLDDLGLSTLARDTDQRTQETPA